MDKKTIKVDCCNMCPFCVYEAYYGDNAGGSGYEEPYCFLDPEFEKGTADSLNVYGGFQTHWDEIIWDECPLIAEGSAGILVVAESEFDKDIEFLNTVY